MTAHPLLFKPPGDDLPIFTAECANYTAFYTPGYLAVAVPQQATTFAHAVTSGLTSPREAAELRRQALVVRQSWESQPERTFAPVCLTLYLNNECNLRCQYCYAAPTPQRKLRLEPAVVQKAAEIVAANCQGQKRPLTVVFHGGGEPTLDQDLADTLLDIVEQTAADYSLPLFRYIATNGVLSADKARWLARRFDLVGLSCDGPPDIQNHQRPLWGGGDNAAQVEQTARILREARKPFDVRVTLMPASFDRQPEIALYLCQTMQPREIHVEPVYPVGRAVTYREELPSAVVFVDSFLATQQTAREYGIAWRTSGSRPDELHGPYCHVLRDVLQLVPGGAATACFTVTQAETPQQNRIIGTMGTNGDFVLDENRIRELLAALHDVPQPCTCCFNRYHCVRACPEFCPLDSTTQPNGFHCEVQRMLVGIQLKNMADDLHTRIPASSVIAARTWALV